MDSALDPREELPEGRTDEFVEDPQPPEIFRRRQTTAEPPASPVPQGFDQADEHSSAAAALKDVAVALEAEPPAAPAGEGASDPLKQPRTLAQVGLSKAFLTDLTLKIMHYSGTPSSAQLMRRLGLGQAVVQQILTSLQEERLCEVLSQSDLFTGNYRYRLSDRGRARAAEALERTRYAGPAPVTAEQYAEVIRAQQARRQTPSRDQIQAVFDELVLAPTVADAVARALYSGKTTLLYGPSGNGKTRILERFAANLQGAVLVPYAIYAYGQVIRVFDASIHQPLEEKSAANAVKDETRRDDRWVLIKRPAVLLGSEVGLESLDLAYDPQARFYQAPPHIKVQGGLLIVDDLGRQAAKASELMTRWLIAVERGWDSLSLSTGEKLAVPFDLQLLFGTNQRIDRLADEALLRRILYKVEVSSPGPAEFAEILRRLCRDKDVLAPDGAIEQVVDRLYGQPGESPRAAYARDMLDVIVEGASYDGQDPILNEESCERAWRLFMSQHSIGDPA